MTTPIWSPGTLYQPGDIVRPRSATGGAATLPDNPDFETGTFTDWTATAVGGAASGAVSTTYKFTGTKSFFWAGGVGTEQDDGIGCDLVNDFRGAVAPGQQITASCYVMSVPLHREHGVFGSCRLYWYNASDELIAVSAVAAYGDGGPGHGFGTTGQWVKSTVVGVAPAGASFVSIGAYLLSNQGDTNGSYCDTFTWDYISPTASDALVFRAVQPAAGFSGSEEPAWPVVLGETVYDNEVIWEAVATSRVIWEATPILVSGSSEPDFPEAIDGSVVDNSIVWHAISRRIADERCPHSKIVAIAASKVFAGDDDIVAYCSTSNALDWSTKNDAGYLPFGMQSYGNSPVAALGLYRSNLVASSSAGYQMWQVDPNPANMALLDGQPVPFEYHLTLQPVANDLAGLTSLGVRSIGIAGASTNLQAGYFGKGVDPIVKPLIAAAAAAGYEPMSIIWPAAGQYWVVFGTTAVVLTVNGAGEKDMSWSRYTFPSDINDWTLHGTKLFLRSGTKVWEMSAEAEGVDDVFCSDDIIPPILSGFMPTDTTADLSWTAAVVPDQSIIAYRLYRKTDSGEFMLIHTFDGNTFEFTDTGLNALSTFTYKVIATSQFGLTTSSNELILNRGVTPMIAVFSGNSRPVGHQVMTSTDGHNFELGDTEEVAFGDSYYEGACYSAEQHRFVAVGQNVSLNSLDGVTWNFNSITGSFYAVAYSPELDLWVATGDGVIAKSDDGATWEYPDAPAGAWRGAVWCAPFGRFVISDTGNGGFAYSTDGENWTQVPIVGKGGRSLAVNGAQVLAVLGNKSTFSVDGGTTWSTNVTMPRFVNKVAFGNGVYATANGTSDPQSMWSSDGGASWQIEDVITPIYQDYWDICFSVDYGRFFKVSIDPFNEDGGTLRVVSAVDGRNWSTCVIPDSPNNVNWKTICAGRILED